MSDDADFKDKGRRDLIEIRKCLDLTQTAFAALMGMPLRTYQDIEKGPNPVRPVHLKAARWAALMHAINVGRADGLPRDVRDAIRSGCLLIEEMEARGSYQ